MPRRRLLTAAERGHLLALPETDDALIRHYTLSEADLAVIGQRRGDHNRLGEVRDRSYENQRYRASGLNLVVNAIILWNTVYMERAIQSLTDSGQPVDEDLLPHLSPLGWEHINLTGDYVWQQDKRVARGRFRPLRTPREA